MKTIFSRRRALGLLGSGALLSGLARASGHAIEESGFVPIGGIEQWIAIQGADSSNPVIVYLHGGPAEAQSPFLREFAPWTQDFTVVNWDQRGSGKTYGRNGASTPGMAPPQTALTTMVQDAREVVEHIRQRLSKKALVLVGQSWGAILGLHVVKRWPELFSAFVATGLPISSLSTLEDRERWARAQAKAAGDEATLKALDATASLPVDDVKRTMASRNYIMSPSDREYLKIQRDFVGPPPYPTRGDVADWIAGSNFTAPRLWPVSASFDARKLGLDIPLPFFVIQGRDDHVVSVEAARSYVAEVKAPKKAFIPIAGGHFACFTNSVEFLGALRRTVRPLAL